MKTEEIEKVEKALLILYPIVIKEFETGETVFDGICTSLASELAAQDKINLHPWVLKEYLKNILPEATFIGTHVKHGIFCWEKSDKKSRIKFMKNQLEILKIKYDGEEN